MREEVASRMTQFEKNRSKKARKIDLEVQKYKNRKDFA
jgi:hypothetical protein